MHALALFARHYDSASYNRGVLRVLHAVNLAVARTNFKGFEWRGLEMLLDFLEHEAKIGANAEAGKCSRRSANGMVFFPKAWKIPGNGANFPSS